MVDVTYRFLFRSEPRAEDQALDIEDWLDDTGWDIDLEEVQADGTSVEAKASGDEEDFRTEWLAGYRGVRTPAPLPTAVPDESSTSNGTNTARASGQTRAAPTSRFRAAGRDEGAGGAGANGSAHRGTGNGLSGKV